ncbi:MAG: site-specific DNA-methyltransferase [Thioclava sp.]|nr:site-specific DNA-methyltransferase [Thioclava sp.]
MLIVTIDEKEYLRLGLLLEQTFPEARVQMISSVINPKGTARANEFSRIDEYIFFVTLGDARLTRWSRDMLTEHNYSEDKDVRWRGLARTGRKGLRQHNPGSWYPIYVKNDGSGIHSVGDTVPLGNDDPAESPRGTIAVWPPSSDGRQYSWSVVPATLRELMSRGAVRIGRVDLSRNSVPIYYLSFNQLQRIEAGDIKITGRAADGTLQIAYAEGSRSTAPKTVWNMTSHDAGSHGTNIIRALLPGRRFPFPKSLYAVEDCIRFFVANKPNALILDFFAGSGTTAHAVMRLNRQDGGRRRCICVTNNEVAADEQKILAEQGLQPGDPDWEKWGICRYITFPRIAAAMTGKTPDGEPIKGDYKFTDEFPMAEGFAANLAYFKLDFLDKDRVTLKRAFREILPLLWLKAGAVGPRPELARGEPEPVVFAPAGSNFVVLLEESRIAKLIKALKGRTSLSHVFIVTDSDESFKAMAAEVREVAGRANPDLQVVQLYRDYLANFMINQGGAK